MPYDIFISYAHQGDNTSREAVTALVARLHAELEADFRRRFNRELEIFFDKTDIQNFHHWQVQCHRALRDSRFFVACLSRSYLRSDACRWEWEEWCRHELEHGLVGQGAASLWFVKLEDLDTPEDADLLRRWKGDLLQRFHIQCHEWWHDDHGIFLDAAARSELQQLTEHVAKCLRNLVTDRARRGNLPWPNANFVGREAELASLRAALLDAPEQSSAGIHGVGGMGKTALAQAFAYKEADAFPGGCWLLRCEGRDRLLSVFRTLVTELELELTDEEKLDDARAVQRVFDVLRAHGPVLFLLDNVDRPALLAREQMTLLADQPWAHVLYSTRLAEAEFSKAGALVRSIGLERLSDDQAVDLIRRYQPGQAFASPEHEAAAREIVRELSGLTLAVETAAVYLGQCDPRALPEDQQQHAVDARNYVSKLREDLETGGSEGVMSQLREVTATLRPTLARLDTPARTVLQIASLLAPDGVALPWVRVIAGQSHPELAADAATGESDPWTQLIRSLIGMRLFQPTAEPRVVTMHRILRRVLETELHEQRDKLAISLDTHLSLRSDAILESQEAPPEWELDALVVTVPTRLSKDTEESFVANSLFLTQIIIARRTLNAATDYLSTIHAVLAERAACDSEHARFWQSALAISFETLGDLEQNQGDLSAALGHFRSSRAIRETLATNDPVNPTLQFALSTSDIKLGDLAIALGDLSGALNYFTESHAILKRIASTDGADANCRHDLAVSLNKIGEIAIAQNDPSCALRHFSDCHAILESLAAGDIANTSWQVSLAASHIKLADLKADKADLPGAFQDVTKSHAILERLVTNDPANNTWQHDFSAVIGRLGNLALERGDLRGALQHFTDAHARIEHLAASDTTNVTWQRDLSSSFANLGRIAEANGDFRGAVYFFTESRARLDSLVASDPTNAVWQGELWIALNKISELTRAQAKRR